MSQPFKHNPIKEILSLNKKKISLNIFDRMLYQRGLNEFDVKLVNASTNIFPF
jgi:hypothetical protein